MHSYRKKIAPADFHLPKPAVHRLRAKLPWNYIRCRSRGSSLERFCKLEFGSAIFFQYDLIPTFSIIIVFILFIYKKNSDTIIICAQRIMIIQLYSVTTIL